MAPLPSAPNAAFAALVALLQESSGISTKASSSSSSSRWADLDDRDVEAVHKFEAAGRNCLEKLSERALAVLYEVAGVGPQCKEQQLMLRMGIRKEEMKKIKLMFEKFDRNGDGVIALEEFKDALLVVGLGEHFTSDELDVLVEAVDKNGDSFINLEEFVIWLYTSGQLSSSADDVGEEEEEVEQRSDRCVEDSDADHRRASAAEAAAANAEAEARELKCKLLEVRTALEAAQADVAAAAKAHDVKVKRLEDMYEFEGEASTRFWRSVAQSSACAKLGEVIDLETASVLGNGKYGFVLKCRRNDDQKQVVAKLLGIRWAHVAAKEWECAQVCRDSASIVGYDESALLHADDDGRVSQLLRAAVASGKIYMKQKRASFPDRYVCLLEEFMNAGSVQDWMDKDILSPARMFAVMRDVAEALAYMHQAGLTHNDVKPENVLVHRESRGIVVKLADLGLATRSCDRSSDFSLYSMTVVCMTTGEKFGSRKFQPELVPTLLREVAALTVRKEDEWRNAGGDAEVANALAQLPLLLRRLLKGPSMTMAEVRDWPTLRHWCFLDGGPIPDLEPEEATDSGPDG